MKRRERTRPAEQRESSATETPATPRTSGKASAGARRDEIAERLGAWFDVERRDLPWRRTRDPYAIWLSEVMLQQTRVKTVEDYFPRFVAAYPTVADLARADLAEVLGAWSGLGYYRRARALYAGAREVVAKYGGRLPADAPTLRTISGIGPYTAGAIASIAFGAREPLVDGNVARVLARIFAVRSDVRSPAGSREVWALAADLVPAQRPGRHNEALMELGATVCLPREPRCDVCPVRDLCAARDQGIQNELPVAKKKKPPREVSMLALVSRRGRRVLLAQRRSGGLFGGLWEPPMVEDEGDARAEASLAALLGARIGAMERVGEQVHVLTHRKLRITLATAEIESEPAVSGDATYDGLAWKGPSELSSLAMSSLARKVLLAVLPESWHRQIAIGRDGANPTKSTAKPSDSRGRTNSAAGPRQPRLVRAKNPPLQSVFEWGSGGSDDRSGSEKLRQ